MNEVDPTAPDSFSFTLERLPRLVQNWVGVLYTSVADNDATLSQYYLHGVPVLEATHTPPSATSESSPGAAVRDFDYTSAWIRKQKQHILEKNKHNPLAAQIVRCSLTTEAEALSTVRKINRARQGKKERLREKAAKSKRPVEEEPGEELENTIQAKHQRPATISATTTALMPAVPPPARHRYSSQLPLFVPPQGDLARTAQTTMNPRSKALTPREWCAKKRQELSERGTNVYTVTLTHETTSNSPFPFSPHPSVLSPSEHISSMSPIPPCQPGPRPSTPELTTSMDSAVRSQIELLSNVILKSWEEEKEQYQEWVKAFPVAFTHEGYPPEAPWLPYKHLF
ncbi:hypothetical protein CALCODRAFT_487294 [Calocera cornea HHB12733]|uniref:Uncharacterized protein n=1 Tax=Calocera cornea HHB12733 TaxID=1353952 RepID=A0A165D7Q2_9BASI|nr:hypothetical protein CALCODRAFT_487294 [Calocera cornea HHB12733]